MAYRHLLHYLHYLQLKYHQVILRLDLLLNQFNEGKELAAICAAPSVLGKLGILKGKEAICYPGFENNLEGAVLSKEKVVKDGNVVTAKGAGVAIPFALKIVETLKGKSVADNVADSIMY